MTEAPGGLRVLVDGQPMPEHGKHQPPDGEDRQVEGEGRLLEFGQGLEGEAALGLAGFAKAEGYASVHPGLGAEGPELHVSRSATQRPYTNVSKGGSAKAQPQGPSRPPKGRRSR